MRTYYLYKFHFYGALHIGPDDGRNVLQSSGILLHSDTLFSALCIEALRDETARNSLLEEAAAGRFLLSDAFPYRADELFLPKPLIRTEQGLRQMQDPGQRKLFKKLTYLPASLWDAYLDLWREGRPFDAAACLQQLENLSFLDERACAAVRGKEETDPYLVRGLQFNKDCGLYCILAFDDDRVRSLVEGLLQSLSFSGVGGKRSVGFGKFQLECCGELAQSACEAARVLGTYLSGEPAAHWMTLNTSLPAEDELEEAMDHAEYSLCRRGGFVHGMGYKKRTVYAFASGSCFSNRFTGQVRNVAPEGRQPALRMLKPMFLGVDV